MPKKQLKRSRSNAEDTTLKVLSSGNPARTNGLWIWNLASIRPDYLDALSALRCNLVYLKVFDDLHGPSFWSKQCTPQLISKFNQIGIKVIGWGYHFDKCLIVDPQSSALEVAKGLACGLDGYVVDVETEVENSLTHPRLDALLVALRGVLGGKTLGYTSFGNPQFHLGVPWKLLDERCDAAFPQIYFEKWTFGSSNEEEVQAVLKAHQDLGLSKPLFPVWGSEEDAIHPASAEVLQSYLNRFPGSSIFRAPDVGQKSQAWRLDYGGGSPMLALPFSPNDAIVAPYNSAMRSGDTGKHIAGLQRLLLSSGANPGPIDGNFGEMTQTAVKAFQFRAGLSPDGVAGPRTWAALGGDVPSSTPPPNELAERLANFAEIEAAKHLGWTGPTSEAEKYLQPFRAPMQRLGQIGAEPAFYNWCAVFVAYCCRNVDIEVPDHPAGFWATMALVESWKYWSMQKGVWLSPSTTLPRRGDIVCFEWNDGDISLDHIGIVRHYSDGSTVLETSEGNRGNLSQNGARQLSSVAGIIRLAV